MYPPLAHRCSHSSLLPVPLPQSCPAPLSRAPDRSLLDPACLLVPRPAPNGLWSSSDTARIRARIPCQWGVSTKTPGLCRPLSPCCRTRGCTRVPRVHPLPRGFPPLPSDQFRPRRVTQVSAVRYRIGLCYPTSFQWEPSGREEVSPWEHPSGTWYSPKRTPSRAFQRRSRSKYDPGYRRICDHTESLFGVHEGLDMRNMRKRRCASGTV